MGWRSFKTDLLFLNPPQLLRRNPYIRIYQLIVVERTAKHTSSWLYPPSAKYAWGAFLYLTFFLIFCVTIASIVRAIIAYQTKIIQRSLEIQTSVHLPRCMHILSEADKRIDQVDIMFCATTLGFIIFFDCAAVIAVLMDGRVIYIDKSVMLWISFGLSSVSGFVIWLGLAASFRDRTESRRDMAWDSCEKGDLEESRAVGIVNKEEKDTVVSADKQTEADEREGSRLRL